MKIKFSMQPYSLSRLFSSAEASRLDQRFGGRPLEKGQVLPETARGGLRHALTGQIHDAKLRRRLFDEIQRMNKAYWQLPGPIRSYDCQFVEYRKGGKYDWHTDAPHYRVMDEQSKTDRVLTAVVLLSDPKNYRGGHLEIRDFSDTAHRVKIRQGEMVIFPSGYLHRVNPITRGVRRIFVMWVRGPV